MLFKKQYAKKILKEIIKRIDEDYQDPDRIEINVIGEKCIVGDSYGYTRSIQVIRDYITKELKLPLNP